MAKKKSISYNPNTALIQGAWQIGQSMMPADTSALDTTIQAGLNMMQKAADDKKEVEDKLTLAADKVLAKAGGLGEELYNYSVDQVQQWQNDYWSGIKMGGAEGEKLKRQAMNNMTQWGNFAAEHKELNNTLAEDFEDGNWSDGMTAGEKATMQAIMGEEFTVGKDAAGTMVYNIQIPVYDANGIKVTDEEGNVMMENKQISYEEYKNMAILKNPQLGNDFKEMSDDYNKSEIFNDGDFKHGISQSIPTTSKGFRGALHDDVMGQNFITMLNEDTGLVNEVGQAIANMDLTDDITMDNITKQDIVNAITDETHPLFDLARSQDIMADKLTNAARNRHTRYWNEKNKQAEENRRKNLRGGSEKYQVAPGTYLTLQQIRANIGDINKPNEGDEIMRHDQRGKFLYENNNWYLVTDKYTTNKQGKQVYEGQDKKVVSRDYVIKQQGYSAYGSGTTDIYQSPTPPPVDTSLAEEIIEGAIDFTRDTGEIMEPGTGPLKI